MTTDEKIQKLKLDSDGTKYLAGIFAGKWFIRNPTNLEISGLGRLTTTSMVLDRYRDENFERYFSYEQERVREEIILRDGSYLITRLPAQTLRRTV